MSIITDYTIQPPSYTVVINDVPGMRLVAEQVAGVDSETVSVTFWAEGDDFAVFEAGLEREDAITDVTILDEQTDGQRLYQLRIPVVETTYREWIQRGGVLLDCIGTADGLAMRMRFPDRGAMAAYRTDCLERNVSFSLTGLQSTEISTKKNHRVVTPAQHEMIVMAAEHGYFEVPRKIALRDLAARFGVSDQAASERLRRGLSNLIEYDLSDLSDESYRK